VSREVLDEMADGSVLKFHFGKLGWCHVEIEQKQFQNSGARGDTKG
jgi:hypothetical protein